MMPSGVQLTNPSRKVKGQRTNQRDASESTRCQCAEERKKMLIIKIFWLFQYITRPDLSPRYALRLVVLWSTISVVPQYITCKKLCSVF